MPDGKKNPFYLADHFKRDHHIIGPTRWGDAFIDLKRNGGLFELEMRRLINEEE